MWLHSTFPLPLGLSAVSPSPIPITPHAHISAWYDSLTTLNLHCSCRSLFMEKKGGVVEKRGRDWANIWQGNQYPPLTVYIYTNAIWCLALSPTKPILWVWLQLKWLKNIFQAILCAKEKANEFIFFHLSYPVPGGVVGDRNVFGNGIYLPGFSLYT